MPVEMVSETRSRKPNVRMKPSERNRVLIQPRTPTVANASLFQTCSSRVCSAERTVVAPIKSVTTLTSVATTPCVSCELLIAPKRIFAVEGPKSPFSCASICEYAAVAPTIQPAVVNTMTKSGAIEKAQKNAKEAPVVEALSATQLRAAQLTTAPVFLMSEFTNHPDLRRFSEEDFDVFFPVRARPRQPAVYRPCALQPLFQPCSGGVEFCDCSSIEPTDALPQFTRAR